MSDVEHTSEFEIDQPVELVFPLFSPEGEKLWVPGWDYQNVMDSRDLHEDDVFLTRHHDHGTTDAIWLVKRYRPQDYSLQLYKVEPGDKVGVVSIRCNRLGESRTNVQVGYRYIGLSEKGNSFVADFSASAYRRFIAEWQKLLLKHFE